MAWYPIGPGDPDSIWIETEEIKENPEPDVVVETEEEIEKEIDKENK